MATRTNLCIHGFLVALMVLAVPSCSSRSGSQGQSSQGQHSEDSQWMGFAPYPEARNLCEAWTSVLGTQRGELHWRSFASKDDLDRVAAFYARKDSARAEHSGDGSLTLRHGKELILTLNRASAPNYPKCDQEVRPGENTVIVVSSFLAAGK